MQHNSPMAVKRTEKRMLSFLRRQESIHDGAHCQFKSGSPPTKDDRVTCEKNKS